MTQREAASRIELKPIETKRASEAIYEQIKEMIADGRLKPGDRLPSERSMMDMLQRSRPTIREALRMLERAGFIRTVPGSHGAIVQELNTRGIEQSLDVMLRASRLTLEEMTEYRRLNEGAMAGWAAERRTVEDLEALEALMTQMAGELENYQEFIRLDPEFHALLARAGKNEVAYIITQVLSRFIIDAMTAKMDRMTGEERRSMCDRVLAMHRAVLDAVTAGDAAAAKAAMREHVEAAREDLATEK